MGLGIGRRDLEQLHPPSPGQVWDTFLHMVRNGELVRHILISLRRILIGFFWAFLASCLLASLNLLFPRLRDCYGGSWKCSAMYRPCP